MADVVLSENELLALRRSAGIEGRQPQPPQRQSRARSLLERAILPPAPEPAAPTALENGANADDELAALRPMLAQIEQLEGRLAKAQPAAALPQAREAGYTDDGVQALQQFMAARGITDPIAAMTAFERENPQPEPIMTGGVRAPWQARLGAASEMDRESEQISLKPLLEGNDEGFLSGAIAIALRDIRK